MAASQVPKLYLYAQPSWPDMAEVDKVRVLIAGGYRPLISMHLLMLSRLLKRIAGAWQRAKPAYLFWLFAF